MPRRILKRASKHLLTQRHFRRRYQCENLWLSLFYSKCRLLRNHAGSPNNQVSCATWGRFFKDSSEQACIIVTIFLRFLGRWGRRGKTNLIEGLLSFRKLRKRLWPHDSHFPLAFLSDRKKSNPRSTYCDHRLRSAERWDYFEGSRESYGVSCNSRRHAIDSIVFLFPSSSLLLFFIVAKVEVKHFEMNVASRK